MAKFSVEMPKELLAALDKLENEEEVALKMVNGAIPIVAEEMRANVAKHHNTGGLEESVTVMKKGTKTKNGAVFNKAYFDGYETREYKNGNTEQVAHALKAMAIEYGSSKQKAEPFLSDVLSATESAVIDKMQEIFNEEVKK